MGLLSERLNYETLRQTTDTLETFEIYLRNNAETTEQARELLIIREAINILYNFMFEGQTGGRPPSKSLMERIGIKKLENGKNDEIDGQQ